MRKSLPSPMLPYFDHDETAEQLFVIDLKKYIGKDIEPLCRTLTATVDAALPPSAGRKDRHIEVRDAIADHPIYQTWVIANKTAQDMMWQSIADPADAQSEELESRAKIEAPKGSLTLDPDFEAPNYIAAQDVHRMPGGYLGDFGDDDVRQGLLYDGGSYIYNLGGRNGGHLNDGRGHTLMSHVLMRDPDIAPKKMLEMGCSAGNSSVAMALTFPDAEYHAIDVGASMLRYAHARAEKLGAAIHFSQQNAEATNFEDNSFDLVFSCVMIHETSNSALRNIFAECARVLKPGGMMVHLEVPARYEDLDTWSRIRGDYEMAYNHEPYWRGALTADFAGLAEHAGFDDIQVGFQDASRKAEPGTGVMRDVSRGVHASWLVISGVKPA
ncbi:MAG: class I SAM-dependent methyltransferase [Pseudomonadota bacterium]